MAQRVISKRIMFKETTWSRSTALLLWRDVWRIASANDVTVGFVGDVSLQHCIYIDGEHGNVTNFISDFRAFEEEKIHCLTVKMVKMFQKPSVLCL